METIQNKNGVYITVAVLFLMILLSGCTNSEPVAECLKGHTYGFWAGLWHGFIAPVDLIISLWNKSITVYAQNNNGAWYAFGFLIGSGGWGFLGGRGASKKWK